MKKVENKLKIKLFLKKEDVFEKISHFETIINFTYFYAE